MCTLLSLLLALTLVIFLHSAVCNELGVLSHQLRIHVKVNHESLDSNAWLSFSMLSTQIPTLIQHNLRTWVMKGFHHSYAKDFKLRDNLFRLVPDMDVLGY